MPEQNRRRAGRERRSATSSGTWPNRQLGQANLRGAIPIRTTASTGQRAVASFHGRSVGRGLCRDDAVPDR
eukprot:10383804-Alexandrium_andersonii.AAC.1